MKLVDHRLLLTSAAIALSAISAPSFAQQDATVPATNVKTPGVEEIIVTATRQSTSIQRTPVAVTALSGKTLTDRGATTLLDVQNSTPSLTVSSRSNTGSTSGGFTIRGIGVDATSSSSAVGLYVDEVYYPAGAGNLLGLFDVDRVEVLRGPQGTLFGRNTIAGAIQYVTIAPSQTLGGYLIGSYGNLSDREIGGAINVPITGTLAVRASARYHRDGGFVYDELNGFDRGQEVTKQGRIAVRWDPISSISVDLKGEVLNLEGNGRAIAVTAFNSSLNPPGTPGGGAALVFAALGSGLNPASLFTVTPSGRDYRFAGFNDPDSQNFDFRTGQGKISWQIADHATLKSITAYSYSRNNSLVDIDNTPVPIVGANRGIVSDYLFTQELQLIGSAIDTKLHYTLGAYYFNLDETTTNQLFHFGTSPLEIAANGGDYKTKTDAKALYGQLTYNLTDRLSLAAGLRYSRESVTASFLNAQFPNPSDPAHPVVAPAQFAPSSTKFNDLSPSGVNLTLGARV